MSSYYLSYTFSFAYLILIILTYLKINYIPSVSKGKLSLCCQYNSIVFLSTHVYLLHIRHFSVAPYITICPSTETYFGLYLRGAMSAVTRIYLFHLLLNIIFFAVRSTFTLTKSAFPDEMPHDGISQVCTCKKHVPENIFHN